MMISRVTATRSLCRVSTTASRGISSNNDVVRSFGVAAGSNYNNCTIRHHRQQKPAAESTSRAEASRTVTTIRTINTGRIFQEERPLSTAAAAVPSLNEDDDNSNFATSAESAFPSIVIGHGGKVQPHGSFAEAQAKFLDPDPEVVESLCTKLQLANMGIVAHYYMDVELQGTLQAIGRSQALDKLLNNQEKMDPVAFQTQFETIANADINTLKSRVSIADSLAMGDHAVRMCRDEGVTSIACLGVDFMAESVQAILQQNGYGHVPVYRATSKAIGCSLAESAERDSYRAWLQMGMSSQKDKKSLHVVYINTSLETKAVSASIMPTITCTSSNVLKTILQASNQIHDLQIYYGPDTYMGDNLVTLLDAILKNPQEWTNERIQQDLHPQHTIDTISKLRHNLKVFPNGNCVVHHMFGTDVVKRVLSHYKDAYVTAHLEVPGEMFHIAMEYSMNNDRGVVGSTSDILKFISRKVAEAATSSTLSEKQRLKFVLGTEAGMVTSIVRSVQSILDSNSTKNVEAEIIFPVASEAVTAVSDDSSDLSVVPGVSGGEGCSTAGGCATCPFMKMNDLDALSDVVDMVIESSDNKLKQHLPPKRLEGKQINGINAIEYGVEPIQFMRDFMKEGQLSPKLVERIMGGAK